MRSFKRTKKSLSCTSKDVAALVNAISDLDCDMIAPTFCGDSPRGPRDFLEPKLCNRSWNHECYPKQCLGLAPVLGFGGLKSNVPESDPQSGTLPLCFSIGVRCPGFLLQNNSGNLISNCTG